MNRTNEEKQYCIYMHRFPNKKVYIGQTCKNPPTQRWYSDGSGYLVKDENGKYEQPLIAHAINKYGWGDIEHIILFENLTKQNADRIEKICIVLFRANNRDYGYNIQSGGSDGRVGVPLSEETKKKISEARKGKYIGKNSPCYGKHPSEETREKMSKAQKERYIKELHPMKGKHLLEETKQKISNSLKGKLTGDKNPFYGRQHTEETKRKIGESSSKRRASEETRKKLSAAHMGSAPTNAKIVVCEEKNMMFPTIKVASNYTGATCTGIVNCCKEKQKTSGGYHWHYATEEEIKQYKIIDKLEAS